MNIFAKEKCKFRPTNKPVGVNEFTEIMILDLSIIWESTLDRKRVLEQNLLLLKRVFFYIFV